MNNTVSSTKIEDSLLSSLLECFSTETATKWLRQKFDSYDHKAGLDTVNGLMESLAKDEKKAFASIEPLGYIKGLPFNDGMKRPIVVAAIKMTSELTNRNSRSRQFSIAKKIIVRSFTNQAIANPDTSPCTQGLFFFYDDNSNFRISLVTCSLDGKKLVSSTAKRQSFFCRTEANNNIVRRQLSPKIRKYEDLLKAFSVEAVTREFYTRLFNWYQWACHKDTGVSFPNKIHDKNDDRDMLPEAIIRLITRLMFVWFVKQKDLIPNGIFQKEKVCELLGPDFCPDATNDGTYYRAILQNLFFATLNCPESKRGFVQDAPADGKPDFPRRDYRCTTKYRYKDDFAKGKDKEFLQMMQSIPFMNCALFDCLDRTLDEKKDADEIKRLGDHEIFCDGFSRRTATAKKPSYQAFVPNCLFFYDKPNKENHEGIIKLFDQYEFTVDENTAEDADVALDPELLGKVFENLLGAFNPETQEAARKSTGSFYTPREIVDYMSSESLKNYLKTKVPSLSDQHLQRLFDKNDDTEAPAYLQPATLAQTLDALYNCRILDPACGSGAFPMGLLHLMTSLFEKLDANCTSIRKKIKERYENDRDFLTAADWMTEKERQERIADIEDQKLSSLHHPNYTRKLYIIENCIYGVDIQPIATQISKLRFFISLLCDQLRNKPSTDDSSDKFLALPNLEAKFVCANTLISLPQSDSELDFSSPELTKLRKKLAAQRRRYFFARTFETKKSAQDDERQIRREIKQAVKSLLSTPDESVIRQKNKELSALETRYEEVKNPKWEEVQSAEQQDLFGNTNTQDKSPVKRIDTNAPKRKELETAMAKCRSAISKEQAKATQSQTGSAADDYAEMVANWNPYDQNASCAFFDPDWMFGIKNGFDIVIGNPPYINIANLHPDKYREILKGIYRSAKNKSDMYAFFIERGLQFLNNNGFISYIIPHTWKATDSFTNLREIIFEEHSLKQVVNLEMGIFGAIVKPMIVIISYKHKENYQIEIRDNNFNYLSTLNSNEIVKEYEYKIDTTSNSIQKSLFQKIENNSVPLCNIIEFSRGIKTSNDRRFILSEPGCDCFKVYRGRNIKAYSLNWAGEYIWYRPDLMREKAGCVPYNKDFFCVPQKIVTQRVNSSFKLLATIDDHQNFFLDTTNVSRFKSWDGNTSLKYICALLNSKVINFWYCNKYRMPTIGIYELHSIPIKKIHDEKTIVYLVDCILNAKRDDQNADTSVLESKIDAIIYDIYGLTDEEIAIVEGNCEAGNESSANRGQEKKNVANGTVNGKAKAKSDTAKNKSNSEWQDEELD